MHMLSAATGLALPVLLGALWLGQLVPVGGAARTVLVWGNGALLGLLLLPQLMLGLDGLGIPLTFLSTGSLATALVVLALISRLFVGKRENWTPAQANRQSAMTPLQKLLFIFCLLLIALRLATLGLEILGRPLFPWDATTHWATKAKVWFEYHRIVPFVRKGEWLALGGAGVFTDLHPDYPSTIPLLQVWMNLALGQWNTSLMNLPWLLCLAALGCAFYAQLRIAGLNAVLAIVFTYLLLSMPLLNIHVALAGYADLFLGAAYCCALMAFHNWVTTRQRWQALLALFFAIACPLIKDEGLIWLLTFVPAHAVLMMSKREAAKLFLLFSLLLVLLFLVAPDDLVIAGHPIDHLAPTFHAEGITGIVQSVWLHDNWHLLGYLLLVVIPLGLFMPGAMTGTYLEISIALGAAVAGFLFLFLFTGFGVAASDFTGVGRLSIQLAPGLLFLGALLCNELLARDGVGTRPAGRTA
ncbi:MAG: hypothetical protein R3E50_02075 [Halioglobus sp.]